MASWKNARLYTALLDLLPAFVTTAETPGQPIDRTINVQKLRVALAPERSHEALYKWFRAGKLKPENARDLHVVATSVENVAALKANGRKPPSLQDFLALTLA